MNPVFFTTPAGLRNWFEQHHDQEKELLVGFYKVGSGQPSITWPESVDQALCFGWIDGVRKGIDEHRYCIRFTPRKADSNWSAINIAKVAALTQQGLMHPAGLAIYAKRREDRSQIYLYEIPPAQLTEDYERIFRENQAAWDFFQSQAPYYQRLSIGRVMGAKQEKTRLSRLENLIRCSAEGRKT